MLSREFPYISERCAVWKMIIGSLRISHKLRFPHRRFGEDLSLIFVHGAATICLATDTPIRACIIARLLDMHRETVRRRLNELVKLGVLEKSHRKYIAGKGMRPLEKADAPCGARHPEVVQLIHDTATQIRRTVPVH